MPELYSDIPELGAQELAILRRKKIAEAMLAAGQMPVESIGTAGGAPIPISPLQGLAQLAKAYMGGRDMKSAEKDYAGLADKRKAMVEAALAKYQSVKNGSPESVQYDQETGAIIPSSMQQATKGNPQQAVADAITSNLPEVRDRAKFDYGESTRIADRDENRKWKEADLQAASDQRMLELQMKMADTKLAREERLAAQKELIQLTASLRTPPQEPAPTVLTDKEGNVTLLDRTGTVIKKLDAAGKPSATYEKTVAAKAKLGIDLDSVISELEKATADGGLIDKSTGSGAGALVDMAAGFVGKATPGSVAVGQMKPIFDMTLKMVPRFEGPQSDKDTISYKDAAGDLANPAVPNSRKKAAGKEILRLMKARKGQFVDSNIAGTEADTPGVTSNATTRVVDW